MDFTIYSIGSSTFLTEVLNGVAMITGSGDIGKMASVGFLLFVMWTGVKYVMNPQQGVPWGQALAGYLMYAVMFGPNVTAYVEDIYTGRVTVTYNVPIGPVAAGSIMSQFGYGLTQLQEQGYGLASDTARLTEGGYIDPLKTLVGLRRKEIVEMALQGVDQSIGGNAKHTLFNYMRDCTMRKPSLEGQASYDDIMTGSLPDALFLNNNFYTTEIYTGGGPQVEDCVTAQNRISFIFERLADSTDIHEQITTVLRSDKLDESIGKPNSIQNLEDFFNGFPEISASNSIALMQAGIVLPLLEAAEAGHLKDGLDGEAALAYNLALQERNAQWAAEGSSFLDTVRPFLAYVEGLSFAIAPLAAIIVIMGAAGISLVGKYMMLFFWIQLWMPILSITNLYLIQAASDQFNTLAAGNSNFNMGSFYAFSSLAKIAETWVGVGSAMMAATPFISLFVVSGSIYTMNQLAGRMSSADSFDEGRVGAKSGAAPAAISEAPVYSFDHGGGTRLSGSEGTMATISASNVARGATQAARGDAVQANDQFAQVYSQMASNTQTSGVTSRLTNAAMQSDSFTSSESFGKAQSTASSVSQRIAQSSQDAQELRGQISTGLAASPSVGGFGFGANASESYTTKSGNTYSAEDVKQAMTQESWSEDDQIALRGEFAQSFSDTLDRTDSDQYTAAQQNQLSSSAGQLYSSSQSLQETREQSNAIELSGSARLNDAGYQIEKNAGAASAVHDAYNSNVADNPMMATAKEQTQNNLVSRGVSPEAAETAGKFAAVMRQSNWESENQSGFSQAFSSFSSAGVFSAVFGTNVGDPGQVPQEGPVGDPHRNQGTEDAAQNVQNVAPGSSYDSGRSAQIEDTARSGGTSPSTPGQQYAVSRDDRVAEARQGLGELKLEQAREMIAGLNSQGSQGGGTVEGAATAMDFVKGIVQSQANDANFGGWGQEFGDTARQMYQESPGFSDQMDEWVSQGREEGYSSLSGFVGYADSVATQTAIGMGGGGSIVNASGAGALGNVIQNYGSEEDQAKWASYSTEERALASASFNEEVRGQVSAQNQFADGDAAVSRAANADGPEALRDLRVASALSTYGSEGVSPEMRTQVGDAPSYAEARENLREELSGYVPQDQVPQVLETVESVVNRSHDTGDLTRLNMALESYEHGTQLSSGNGDIFEMPGNTSGTNTTPPPVTPSGSGAAQPAATSSAVNNEQLDSGARPEPLASSGAGNAQPVPGVESASQFTAPNPGNGSVAVADAGQTPPAGTDNAGNAQPVPGAESASQFTAPNPGNGSVAVADANSESTQGGLISNQTPDREQDDRSRWS